MGSGVYSKPVVLAHLKSDPWKAIELATHQGYSGNIETGRAYGRSGKLLNANVAGKKKYPTMCLRVSGLPKPGYWVPQYKFIAYLIWGAAAFEPGIHVRHLNSNRFDNRGCNLALGTASDNAFDKPEELRKSHAAKGRQGQKLKPSGAKLAKQDVVDIFVLSQQSRKNGRLPNGFCIGMGNKYGVHKDAIRDIADGRTWKPALAAQGLFR